MSELGRLERIRNIRTIWPDEARDFTPWLASPDNLEILAETLGLGRDGLEFEAMELPVGAFRADILCRDTTSPDGDRVLVENQFGKSDHDHLGKLLTYASGLKAKTVVLIGEGIREEHRAALDWLNAISDDDYKFFACEMELWRIGDSRPAPRFNLIVKPNDWSRRIESVVLPASGAITELKQTYVRYWACFAEKLSASDIRIRPRKPLPQQWMGFGIGRTGPELTAAINSTERWIRVELFLHGSEAKTWFSQLGAARDTIEGDLGYAIEWDSLPDRQGARISLSHLSSDPADEPDWPRQHDWLIDHLRDFDRVFRPRVAMLNNRDTLSE